MGPTKRHGNAWRTVGELIEGGYPVAEALAAATSVSTAASGLAGTTGLLAEGYAADVLVVDGGPLPGHLAPERTASGTSPGDAGRPHLDR
jgi:imidazolonepropionase-like amidohydrolase